MIRFEEEMGKAKFDGISGQAFLHIILDVGSERTRPSIEVEETVINLDGRSMKKTHEVCRILTPFETVELFGKEKIQEAMLSVWESLKPNPDKWGNEVHLKVRSNMNVTMKEVFESCGIKQGDQ